MRRKALNLDVKYYADADSGSGGYWSSAIQGSASRFGWTLAALHWSKVNRCKHTRSASVFRSESGTVRISESGGGSAP